MGKGDRLHDFSVVLVRETGAAWLVDPGDQDPIWVPKSQCEFDGYTLTIPEWLAKEKGLI